MAVLVFIDFSLETLRLPPEPPARVSPPPTCSPTRRLLEMACPQRSRMEDPTHHHERSSIGVFGLSSGVIGLVPAWAKSATAPTCSLRAILRHHTVGVAFDPVVDSTNHRALPRSRATQRRARLRRAPCASTSPGVRPSCRARRTRSRSATSIRILLRAETLPKWLARPWSTSPARS